MASKYESLITPFWPGTNLTSFHNDECYGNVTLCNYSGRYCTVETCDLTLAQYEYIPTLGGNALFIAIFGLCLIGQVVFGIRHRTWGFMSAMVLGMLTEIIGYVGRLMARNDPFSKDNFLIYLVCLTIAPAFMTASIYLCLARIVVVYGENLSRFKPRTYTLVFCFCDFLSLLLQAAGGAIASIANDNDSAQTGINIMIAGLSFQVFSLFSFALCCAEFALRLRRHPYDWNHDIHASLYNSRLFMLFLVGLGGATLTIFIRSCYRVAELSAGFGGPLANDEISFMILEGAMIIIAALCLTVFHPGVCFKSKWSNANFGYRTNKSKQSTEHTFLDSTRTSDVQLAER